MTLRAVDLHLTFPGSRESSPHGDGSLHDEGDVQLSTQQECFLGECSPHLRSRLMYSHHFEPLLLHLFLSVALSDDSLWTNAKAFCFWMIVLGKKCLFPECSEAHRSLLSPMHWRTDLDQETCLLLLKKGQCHHNKFWQWTSSSDEAHVEVVQCALGMHDVADHFRYSFTKSCESWL